MTIYCQACSATHTPLWRRGPSGCTLCNACGVKWIRNPQLIRAKLKHVARQSPQSDDIPDQPPSPVDESKPVDVVNNDGESAIMQMQDKDNEIMPCLDHQPYYQEEQQCQDQQCDGVPAVPILDAAPEPLVRRSSRAKRPPRDSDLYIRPEEHVVKKKKSHTELTPPRPHRVADPDNDLVIDMQCRMGLRSLELESLRQQLATMRAMPTPRSVLIDKIQSLRHALVMMRLDSQRCVHIFMLILHRKSDDVITLVQYFEGQCARYAELIKQYDADTNNLRDRIMFVCQQANVNAGGILHLVPSPTPMEVECVR